MLHVYTWISLEEYMYLYIYIDICIVSRIHTHIDIKKKNIMKNND